MGNPLFTNNAGSTFANPVDMTATTVTLVGGGGALFPQPTGSDYFMVTFITVNGTQLEICKCTARAGDTLTVVRAQEGTGAQNFQIGDQCQLRITAATMNTLVQESANAGVHSLTAGSGISVSSSTGDVTVTNTGVLSVNGSTGTVTIQGVPSGALSMWPTATAPTGYLLCTGSAVSRTTYAALFAIIGTTFGVGDGSTTFNLPNYTNRMPYGTTVGATGGSADAIVVSHTHTASSVVTDPTHTHSSQSNCAPNGGGSGQAYGSVSPGNQPGYATTAASTGITVATTNASTGASGTNANLPPYLGINFIIKV